MRTPSMFFVLCLGALCACDKGSSSTKPVSTTSTTQATGSAKETFKTRCATCHGEDGTGGGPAAAALTPKPRNYTDKEWQKSVTDEQIKNIILKGGAAVGKSPNMPPNPDFESNPALVDGLVGIIRGFGK